MIDKNEKITKQELMENIRRERYLLEELLSKLKQDDMIKPELAGGWTVKDVLAHIISWEQRMIGWIDQSLADEPPTDWPETDADVDAINAEIYMDNQNRDLVGILREFKTSHQQALQAVEDLSEEALNDPEHFPWRQSWPLWILIYGNTWEHYQEHRRDIETWLSTKQ